MNRVYVPARGLEDWKARLAAPERHWRPGFSAHSLALTWHRAASETSSGIPADVAAVLATVPTLSKVELLLALPEHEVPLPGGRRPSQTDLWLLGRSAAGLVSIAVEGKVNESFGPPLSEWLADASEGKRRRLDLICKLLGISTPPGRTRYQLLHRTASAVLEAQRFTAFQALMLVHSFSQSDAWLSDYQGFLNLFGVSGGVNQVVSAGVRSGIRLYLGWIRSAFPRMEDSEPGL